MGYLIYPDSRMRVTSPDDKIQNFLNENSLILREQPQHVIQLLPLITTVLPVIDNVIHYWLS